MVLHYLRCSTISNKNRGTSIREQVAFLRSFQESTRVYHKDPENLAWIYRLISSFRFRRPQCIEDSICCTMFLLRYTGNISFHIGVFHPPFEAHAWVQIGNLIVNDTKPAIEKYSEILRIDL
ncbi:lasso peptide biosynthesis B2 protein [Burkholderia cepacia]|uniref:lasso peptide biosynthesis B2 protein n=1 Tax=Burkholderia cepacia TaxID=292 RepID=UPI003857AD0E